MSVELLADMLRIRRMEEKCAELYGQQKIRGFLHLYIGEEAVAADRIENAAVLARPRQPLLGCAAIAEQPLEHDPRVVLGRERRRRARPRQRVHVDAGVAVLALPAEEVQVDGQLQRRLRRVFADVRGGNLIRGDAVADVGAGGLAGLDAGEVGGGGAGVAAAAAGVGVAEAGDDGDVVAVAGEGLEDLRHVEVRALGDGNPVLHVDPVGHVDEGQAARQAGAGDGTGRAGGGEGLERQHRVEQGQGHDGAQASEEGAAG